MVIKKGKGKNTYTITGVTLGKLITIENALKHQLNTNTLTAVGNDVLVEVQRAIKESK